MHERDFSSFRAHATCLAMILAAALCGCRSVDNAQVDLLERELRQQESYIYELEDYLVEYSDKLRECRCSDPYWHDEPSKSTKSSDSGIPEPELADDTPDTRQTRKSEPELADEPLPEPPPAKAEPDPIDPETIDVDQLDEIEVPDLEIGPSSRYEPSRRNRRVASEKPEPLIIPDPVDYVEYPEAAPEPELESADSVDPIETAGHSENQPVQTAAHSATDEPSGTRRAPDQLVIRRVMVDEVASDEPRGAGLLVVVEALNSMGEPIEVGGTASLMVLTDASEGPQRRVDRWDFDEQATTEAWQSSQLGDGLHLQLPLARVLRDTDGYELWARIVTVEGDKLLAKTPLRVADLMTLAEAESSLASERGTAVELTEASAPTGGISTIAAEHELAEAVPMASSLEALPAKPQAVGWKRAAGNMGPDTSVRTAGRHRWTSSSPLHQRPQLTPAGDDQPSASATGQRWTPFK